MSAGEQKTGGPSLHAQLHRAVTLDRRIRVLADQIAALLTDGSTVLDIGTGSGEIAHAISSKRRNLTIEGIDTHVRADAAIPVRSYDGLHVPAADRSYDYVSIVDVLHHTADPMVLLKEAMRVARRAVILKDHNCDSWFARRVMTFTDWFGNRQYGVALEFNFWQSGRWRTAFEELGVVPDVYLEDFGLYPKFTRLIFARNMDFIARLPVPEG